VENLAVSAAETEIVRADLPTRLADTGRDGETHSRGRGESMRSAVEELQKEMVADALRSAGSLRKAAAALEMDPHDPAPPGQKAGRHRLSLRPAAGDGKGWNFCEQGWLYRAGHHGPAHGPQSDEGGLFPDGL
jgi:hypothetical protein